ncbi:MAG TPA: TonB-dependent receptor [Terriglobales bacterium]|nr:TonB-dependent receptor [Terriglobales bacterium]
MFLLARIRWLSSSFEGIAVLTLALSCAAQTSRVAGAIQGTVVDRTGSAIAGASVTLRNQDTNQTRTISTNPEGSFRAGELPVGQYELRVQSPGFSPYVNNAIVISIGRVVQLAVQLAPATVQQQITISEQPPPIDPTQTTEATTIGQERIEESPVVSRNYLDFVLLTPQLTRSNTQGASGGKSALADSGFTFAGLRSRSNSLYIDGVENNDDFEGSARTELSPETVREFQVVNNGLSAESGGGASGPINVVTKGGVNTLHGDAFVFIQNGALNAKDPLTNETEAPALNRFRAGLSAGGPIVRSRTFYYFAGEQEGAHGDDSSLISPTVASEVNGVLGAGAFPRIATRTINPELFRTARAETEVSGRLDLHIADKHSLLLKYALTNNREVGDAFNTGGLVDPSGRGSSFIEDQGVTGSLTSILSNTALNSFRFQVSTRRAVLRTADQTGPEISIAGLVDFGRPYDGNDRRRESHYELSDVASAAKGHHLISFGGDMDWIHENASAYDGFGAVYVFPSLGAFLNGQPDQYRQAFGNPGTHFATPKYSGFIQDHWTLAKSLTIDAGIRYDFEHLPAQFKEDTNDFAPRIGLAYSPSPNWALRAGFGIFFDRYLLAAVNRALQKNGIQAFEQVAYGQAAAQIFQSELGGSSVTPIPTILPSIFTADPHSQTSRSEIASAGVEHLLTPNLTASATFLFARGVRLSRTRNASLLPPVLLTPDNAASLGIPNPFPQQLGRLVFSPARLSPQFDDTYQWENHASSVYDALSLSMNRRLSNEIEFSGSYTLSKAIDDASDFNEQPQNPYLLPAERALSANDQRHRFVFSGTFDLPFGDEDEGKKPSGAIAKLFGNIEAAPILIVGSGRPINPLTGFDTNRSGAFPLSSRPIGFARNSLHTSTQVQFDLRVLKFFKVGEHGKLDFVAESFNLLNHTNVLALNQFYGAESSPIPVFAMPNKAGIPRQLQFSIDFEF